MYLLISLRALSRSRFRSLGAAMAFVGLCLAASAGLVEHLFQRREAPSVQALPLAATTNVIEFGTVMQGAKDDISVEITNLTDCIVRIAHVETSCECISIQLGTLEIAPRDRTIAAITLDLSREPQFCGALSVPINVFGDLQEPVLSLVAVVNVVAVSSVPPLPEHATDAASQTFIDAKARLPAQFQQFLAAYMAAPTPSLLEGLQ